MTSHKMTGTRFYSIWKDIKKRTKTRAGLVSKYYYNKGIKCLWNSFIEFQNDMYGQYLKHVEEYGKRNTTIDRIDSNGHYCRDNCRWATYTVQANNKSRTQSNLIQFENKLVSLKELSSITGINYGTLRVRKFRKLDLLTGQRNNTMI